MIFICVVSLCWILFLVSASGVPENITRAPGDVAIFTCKTAKKDLQVVKWTKSNLKDKYVFLQVDSHIESENQDQSFKNRVDLQDRQMKDGDVSLILRNVTINDAGTYECYVKTQTNRRKRANLESISIINLRVVPPGNTGGSVGVAVGLSVFAVLVAAAAGVGFLIYKKRNSKQSQDSFQLSSVELQPLRYV